MPKPESDVTVDQPKPFDETTGTVDNQQTRKGLDRNLAKCCQC